MKTKEEIKKMSESELTAFVRDERTEAGKQRFTPTGVKPHEHRARRRHVARALTELRRRSEDAKNQ